MKSAKEQSKMLARYRVLGSARAVAEEFGVSHNTVLALVRQDAKCSGLPGAPVQVRARSTDLYREHIEQLVAQSKGKIRADIVHDKITAMGFTGSPRTTRRIVREIKDVYRLSSMPLPRRPWLTEPGLWVQYDFGDGPVIDGEKTVLFVAWLAWSRFRVVFPLRNRKMTTVLSALDRLFRALGGVPSFVLTDNEKTVVKARYAGIPEFHPVMETFCAYYATSIQVCQPADPATKGGVEASVKLAKEDIVPKETNLRAEYDSFAQLEQACQEFMDKVNKRVHRVTGAPPQQLLEDVELDALSPLPVEAPYTLFGEVRKVPPNTAMISVDNIAYSVPEELVGKSVYVTFQTHAKSGEEELVVYYHDLDGVEEVARHVKGEVGSPQINPEHFSTPVGVAGYYSVKPQSRLEKDFLAIGPWAETWLRLAVINHAPRIKTTMATVVEIAGQFGNLFADRVLEQAHRTGKLSDWDIQTIATDFIDSGKLRPGPDPDEQPEPESLSHATTGWEGFYTTSYQVQPESIDVDGTEVEGGEF